MMLSVSAKTPYLHVLFAGTNTPHDQNQLRLSMHLGHSCTFGEMVVDISVRIDALLILTVVCTKTFCVCFCTFVPSVFPFPWIFLYVCLLIAFVSTFLLLIPRA